LAEAVTLEHVSRVAPLALRFRDELLGLPVADGLAVTARAAPAPAPAVAATVSPSGVFAFHALPGLVARPLPPARPRVPVLFGEGDDAFWSALPPPLAFTVEVTDPWGRFLPCAFQVAAPARGLFLPPCLGASPPGSPPDPEDGIPLFSAPTRAVGGPVAVVRAELWDPVAAAPAAWALVEGRLGGGGVHRAVADGDGRLALFVPYPPPDDPFTITPASFVPGLGPPLMEQEWPLQLDAFYARQAPAPAAPDLCAVLAQPPARLWDRYAGHVLLAGLVVRFGRELVIRSADVDSPAGRVRVTG
jgi:hypothetical protein